MQFIECNGCIVCRREGQGCRGLAVCRVEAHVRAVVNLDQHAVLVKHDRSAVAVDRNRSGEALVIDQHTVLGSVLCFDFGVVQPLAFLCREGLVVDGDGCGLRLEVHTGNGHCCTDGLIVQEELAGTAFGIVGSGVGGDDDGLAVLSGSKCFVDVARGGALTRVLHTVRVVCVVVLSVRAVIDPDDHAVCVHHERRAVAVCEVNLAVECGCEDNESKVSDAGKLFVDCNAVKCDIHFLVADRHGADALRLDLDLALKLGFQLAVGDLEADHIRTCFVDVEAAAIHDRDLGKGHIVVGGEGPVVVLDDKARKDRGVKVERGVAHGNKDLGVAADRGLLVDVGGQCLIAVHPEEADHVADRVDDVVVHESASVGISRRAGIVCLHHDRIPAGGDGHVLSKCGGNRNILIADLDGGHGRSRAERVRCIDEFAVRAVAAFHDHAVLVEHCGAAVAALNGEDDVVIRGVMEHAAHLGKLGVLVDFGKERVCKAQDLALPLVLAEIVGADLKSDGGKRSKHRNGTGSGDLLFPLGRLIGDRVGTGGVGIKLAVVKDDQGRALFVDGDTEEQFNRLARIDFHLAGGYGDFKSRCRFIRIGFRRLCRRLLGNGFRRLGCSRFGALVAARARHQRDRQDKNESEKQSDEQFRSFHSFLLKIISF